METNWRYLAMLAALWPAAGCAVSNAPTQTTSVAEIGVAAPVGDLDLDGITDPADAVSFLTSWGLRIYTYGLTDDDHNT